MIGTVDSNCMLLMLQHRLRPVVADVRNGKEVTQGKGSTKRFKQRRY